MGPIMLCPTLRQILFPFGLKLRILFQVVCGRSAAGSASPCQGEGRGFESRRPLENARHPEWVARRHGGVTERRGSGLQSRVHGFKSRLHLHECGNPRTFGRLRTGSLRFRSTDR